MAMMFRILTEDVNRAYIYQILDSRVDGYTVSTGVGCWKGQRESSLAIDLIGAERSIVYDLADSIKAANKQESVLVLELEASATFI